MLNTRATKYSKVDNDELVSANSPAGEQSINTLFMRAVVERNNNPALIANKSDILNQAFANLGWENHKKLSTEDFTLLENELEHIVYADGYLPSLSSHGDNLEYIDHDQSPHEQYVTYGRNLLKYFWRDIRSLSRHVAFDVRVPDGFTDEIHSQAITDAYRAALKAALNSDAIIHEQYDRELGADDLKQYEFFQSHLLVSYVNQKPDGAEHINILQARLVNNEQMDALDLECHSVSYRLERLDLSPPSGPLSWLLEKKDRFYAYGLVSEDKTENSRLVLLGTPPPPAQGAEIANIYNFYPLASIGEAHYLGDIIRWVKNQRDNGKKVEIVGHSKGATLAMILAAICAPAVAKATALNPVALSSSTYNRLLPRWNGLDQRPLLQATVHNKDLFWHLEKHFLPGTQLYRVIPTAKANLLNISEQKTFSLKRFLTSFRDRVADSLAAHNEAYAGSRSAIFLRVNFATEKKAKLSEFLHDAKYIYNFLSFPVLYGVFFFQIIERKLARFYQKHIKLINGLIIVAALATFAALLATGILAPLGGLMIVPVFKLIGVSLSAELTLGIAISLGVISSLLMPLILKAARAVVVVTTMTAIIASQVVAGILAATLSGLKLGFKLLSRSCHIRETEFLSNQARAAHENSVGATSSSISMASLSSSASILVETKDQVFEQIPLQKHQTRYLKWKQGENYKMVFLGNNLQQILLAEIQRLTESRGRVVDNDAALNQEIENEIGARRRELRNICQVLSQYCDSARLGKDVSFEDYKKEISAYLKVVMTERGAALDKYSNNYCAKFAIKLANAVLGITVVPSIFKARFTGSFFFSPVGKTMEAVEKAYELSKCRVG